MSLCKLYDFDCFISYSRRDNRQFQWVSKFDDCLQAQLAIDGCSDDVEFFRDTRDIVSNADLDETIISGLKRSAILLVMLSNNYISCEYCLRELVSFVESAGGPDLVRQRLIVVRIADLPVSVWPECLRKSPSCDLFRKNTERGIVAPISLDFPGGVPDDRLLKLAKDLLAALKLPMEKAALIEDEITHQSRGIETSESVKKKADNIDPLIDDGSRDLAAQVASLARELGEAQVRKLRIACRMQNAAECLSESSALVRWLDEEGQRATKSTRCKAYTLLGDICVAYGRADARKATAGPDLPTAVEMLDRAKQQADESLDAEDKARLRVLEARLAFLDGDQETGLALLEDDPHPQCVRFRLIMLQELGRVADAIEVFGSLDLDSRWADVAITLHCEVNDFDAAQRVCNWAAVQQDEIAYQHCLIALARGHYVEALKRFPNEGRVTTAGMTQDEISLLRRVIAILDPLTQPSLAKGRPQSGLEVQGLELAFRAAHLLNDVELASFLNTVLAKTTPISVQAGYAILWQYAEYSEDVTQRLRNDWPDSFDANFVALAAQTNSASDLLVVLPHMNHVCDLASTVEEKERLARLLAHVTPQLPLESQQPAVQHVRGLLGDEHPLFQLLQAKLKFAAGDCAGAANLAHCHTDSDDPAWRLLNADLCEKHGDFVNAVAHLVAVSKSHPSPGILWRLAAAASRIDRWELTRDALERLIELQPDADRPRTNLVNAYLRLGSATDLRKAIQQLKWLAEKEPLVSAHVFQQAQI